MEKNGSEYKAILRNLPMWPPVPAEVPWPFYSGDQLREFAVAAILKDRECHGREFIGRVSANDYGMLNVELPTHDWVFDSLVKVQLLELPRRKR